MYKSQGVILYIQKIRDSQIRMVIFTEEFGKITCWSKKLVHTDVGNIVSLLIERKGSINSIKSIDTIASLGNIFTNYTEVLSFLSILETLYTLLPESLEQRSIYDDLAKSILMVSEGKRNIEGRDILNI